jgi:hypothetical protein
MSIEQITLIGDYAQSCVLAVCIAWVAAAWLRGRRG